MLDERRYGNFLMIGKDSEKAKRGRGIVETSVGKSQPVCRKWLF